MADGDYDSLLANLYSSISEPERMAEFLRGLNAASGSHLTVLVRHDAEDPANNCFCTPGMDAGADVELIARYESEFSCVDDKLWFQRSLDRMGAGVVVDGDSVASKQEIKRTAYYAEILQPLDIMHSIGMCGLLTQARSVFLTPCRSERAGPYAPPDIRFLSVVGRHWANACALQERFRQLEDRSTRAQLRGRGLFLLDSDLRWVSGNEAAEHMVAIGWWRGHPGGRLTCPSPITRAAWHAAQRAMASPASPESSTIPVYDADGCLVAFACLQPYGVCANGSGLPAFALFVRPLGGFDEGALVRELKQLFALTSAESRLAVALQNHGSLAHAATVVGITEGSARVRLQGVYDKTGLHRQGELMRMLDALADAIA